MSHPIGTAEAQEEDMFGRITSRIDELVNGAANFKQLKENIHTALEIETEVDLPAMVARIAAAHELAKRYEPALATITAQENLLAATAETITALGNDVTAMRAKVLLVHKRADDLQAEKDLIAEKLGLIKEELEPDPDPPADPAPDEPLIEHAADGADHDSEAAE